MKPRDYQLSAVESVIDYYENGGVGNSLLAMPTGTGKSVVIAALLMCLFKRYAGHQLKVLMLTHSRILIKQNYEKLLQMWPTAPVGICSDGLGRKDFRQAIIFGGIGTVAKIPLYFGHVDIIIVDEAHMISLKESGQYNAFIKDIKVTNPKAVLIGLTATKFRMGQGLLTQGEGAMFDEIVCDMTTMDAFNWFLAQGYLCRLRPVKVSSEYDFSEVRTIAGEYNQADCAKAVDKPLLTQKIIAEAVKIGRVENRNSWLVFATGVKNTIAIAEELIRQGVNATYIHSNTKNYKMSNTEVESRIAAYLRGEFEAIVNNGILTTGFDNPALDYIIFTRKTKSVPLWVQMLGRGTRPFYAKGFDLSTTEGRLNAIANSIKRYCLVADFAGNCRDLGPINDPKIPKLKDKKEPGDAPVRICDKCGTYNHASATVCDHCGAEFPRILQLSVEAANDELIKEAKAPEPIKIEIEYVHRVEYAPHMKLNRPPSIRVTYYTGATRRRMEWICLEHGGIVTAMARNWWKQRCDIPPPETTVEALTIVHHLREPKAIHIRTDNGNNNIINYDF